MANIEEDLKKVINVKKVVKAVKSLGYFALYQSSEDSTLLLTRNFILNLNPEQAWEVQCALLVKELGKWYTTDKDGPIAGNPVKETEIDIYYSTVKNNSLEIVGFTELYLNNVALYAGEAGYIGIKREYIEMAGGLCVVKKSKFNSFVILSDYHVVLPVTKLESEYLQPLLF